MTPEERKELFDWRQRSDYENVFEYKKQDVEPLFNPVEEMIQVIEQMMENAL